MVLDGLGQREVARRLKVSPSCVNDWMGAYRKLGWKGLERTFSPGPPLKFTSAHRRVLKGIAMSNPRKCGYRDDLWTVSMIQNTLNRRMGTDFSWTTILRNLHALGMTFQKPKKIAHEQDEKEVDRWIKRRLPAILREAKRRKATVFFEDESGIELGPTRGGTWAPKGETPVVRRSGKRQKVTVAGAISSKGGLHMSVFGKGGMTGKRYALFLEALKKSTAGRLWLSMMDSRLTDQKSSKKSSKGTWVKSGSIDYPPIVRI